MKTLSVIASLGLLLTGITPAAELIISSDPITPTSTLELRFDEPMINKDEVGSAAAASPLTAIPPLEGEFKWTSTRSGQFHFAKPPTIGTNYQFSLRGGLKTATGKAVAKDSLGEYRTDNFRVAEYWRDYPYSFGDSVQRTPQFLLQFTDAVQIEGNENAFSFTTEAGDVTIPAKIRSATFKDFKRGYKTTASPFWAEQSGNLRPEVKDGVTRPNAVFVESAEPLPVGKGWKLVVSPDLKNTEGTATFIHTENMTWGTILPLQVKTVSAEPHFDRPHSIEVVFNKGMTDRTLKPEEQSARALPFVQVEPAVDNLKVEVGFNNISIRGEFALNTDYTVTVKPGLPGGDGLPLGADYREVVTFNPSPVFVSTSATLSTQQAGGNGVFDIYGANYKDLRVRVKKLREGELLKARNLYTQSYRPGAKQPEAQQKYQETPYENFPGTEVYDKTFTNDKLLQQSTLHKLQWRDILGQQPAAPVFVEITATPQDGAPPTTIANRAIIEFTDIGLLVKSSGKDTLVYSFSLRTGEPLPGVSLSFADANLAFLQSAQTDASGLAKLPALEAAWVLGRLGEDCTAVNFADRGNRIGLWSQNINVAWASPWRERHQTFLFSDRPVYKPGDTAHVKAISRVRSGDDLSLGSGPLAAIMTVKDPRGREILSKEISFSANGTWSDDISLPDAATGWYSMTLKYKRPGANNAEADEDDVYENGGFLELRVDEYKPNSFEVKLEGSKHVNEDGRIQVPLSARYYMGKSLSKASVNWSANISDIYEAPAAYSDYHFGDVEAWWQYGKDRDDETASNEDDEDTHWNAYGEATLDEEGKVTLSMPEPPPHKVSLPQVVTVYADVTDVNEQSISTSTEFRLPGADFVLGARKGSWYATAGKPFNVDFVALTPAGTGFTAVVPVQVKIERQEWNTVRVEGAGGATVTKNQSSLIEEYKGTLDLTSTNGQASMAQLNFTPQKGGTYFLTATALDAQGKTLLTRMAFYSLGGNGFPWSWEDGAKMTLQPDKTTVKPGEEVSIVVKTPISGKALVTVERNRIHRQFVTQISPEQPVIKVKMDEQDAPNAFVSVVVIRGAAASPQADPMPEYRVGYCELTVESGARQLLVDTKASQDTVRPGTDITVEAVVRDQAKQPVANAEVTLFAVDEGVLSLMDYTTPNPLEFFHAALPLGVSSYTNLDSLIREALNKRYRGNKGITIGGGEDEKSADDALRKNFVATALWQSTLTTDANGKVTAKVKVPDSLTRYRIMAVAVKDMDRFGTGESAFTVNKPLMVQPVVPRFAHMGDEILLKAVVHNTTTQEGTVEVELQLDDKARLITEERPYALIGVKNRVPSDDRRSEKRIIALKPGETTSLAFPVVFEKTGTVVWRWGVRTVKWADQPLADAVESRFEVTHPAPALREVQYLALTSAGSGTNLLKKVNPQLLESEGALRLDLSQSRLSEARDALEFLLNYPYGCVEQTTSTMLPWLALSRYDAMFPDMLQKEKVGAVIKRSANRILSMQTDAGGLSYWPGSDTPEFWATAYGGFGLLKAKEWGAPVPDEAINKMTGWLSEQLRGLELGTTMKANDLNDAALALYTLAKAGKAESAYQTTLYSRRDNMPETARLFLALSMCITKAPNAQIAELVKPVARPKTKWDRYWLGENTANGLRLIVCAHLGLIKEGDAIADELMQRRSGRGDWGTTFSNAWVLQGLTVSERAPKDPTPMAVQYNWGTQRQEVSLPSPTSSGSAFFDFKGAKPLTLTLPEGKSVRSRVEVKAWPDIKTLQPVQKGFGIKRRYQRLNGEGELEPAENLRVGDMIVVTLEIDVKRGNRYLALEDSLPSVFEPVNPEFTTQNTRADAAGLDNEWYCDHRELRHDKALFFTNDWSENGRFELRYLARVIAEGDVMAPPAKIEAMYEPGHYGLSEATPVKTLPSAEGADIVGK